jgi:FG-GAP-like repeat/FG-GAP repeat
MSNLVSRSRVAFACFLAIISSFSLGCGGGGTTQSGGGGGTTTPPSPPSVNYTPVSISSGGTKAASLAIADFNGDGKADIAASNFVSNTVAVFLNQGGGAFATPIINTIQIPNGLGPLAVGDFNEDGKPDLVAGTISGPEVALVLLGNGDGIFTRIADIPNSFGFLRGRVADLNGDKHLDFIGCGNGNIQAALGNGDGSFKTVVYLPNGPFPGTYAGCDVGDFNGDKKLDIFGADFTQNTTSLVVFEGNADGTFQVQPAFDGASSDPDSVSAADFNGDGKLDALVGYNAGAPTILLGNGDGSFGIPAGVTGVNGAAGVVVLAADLNNDDKPDALAADYTNGVLGITLSPGVPEQLRNYTFNLAPGLSDIAVGDLNGDGLLDIVVANSVINQITIYLSQ